MTILPTFEELLTDLRAKCASGDFGYTDPEQSFKSSVRTHFPDDSKHYGAYVITSALDGTVLYIGRGGTVTNDGQLDGQDVVERLRNTRDSTIPADTWFRGLLSLGHPLRIEYFFPPTPISPAYLEALLLQTYLSQYGRLPQKNRSL